jgi:hypothetical protein
MQYVLTGFTPDSGFRLFAFQGIRADQTRTAFTVRADLTLTRAYGILVQELPLLCREMLERTDETAVERALTYSEDEMRLYAGSRAADKEEAQRKRSLRKTPPRPRPSGSIVMGMSREPVLPTLVGGA